MSFIDDLIRLMYLLSTRKDVEPQHIRIDLLGMQDPPTPKYSHEETKRLKLIPLGERADNGLCEYIDLDTIFEHMLAVSRSGRGKSTYFLRTILFSFISDLKDSSPVFMDAMDAVIEEVIALCKLFRREYVVLPDAGMNAAICMGGAKEWADHLVRLYRNVYVSGEGENHYDNTVCGWIEHIMPCYFEAYKQPPILRELKQLAASSELRSKLMDAIEDKSEGSAWYDYQIEYADYEKVKNRSLSDDLKGFRLFVSRIAKGKYEYLLNQRNGYTLDYLIDGHPQKPVILIRCGGAAGSRKAELSKVIVSMISAFAINRDRRENTHPVLFYIDEGGLMIKPTDKTAEELRDLLTTARKQRCTFCISMQSLDQIPQEHRITFKGSCQTTFILPDVMKEDAEILADMAGKAMYRISYPSQTRDNNGSKSTQISYKDEEDYILRPSVISNIKLGEVIVLKSHNKSKRTPLHLKFKPLPFNDPDTAYYHYKKPYIEPAVPDRPPATIWEEQGVQLSFLPAPPKALPPPETLGKLDIGNIIDLALKNEDEGKGNKNGNNK